MDLRGWNTAKVTSIRRMFALSKIKPDLRGWDLAQTGNIVSAVREVFQDQPNYDV